MHDQESHFKATTASPSDDVSPPSADVDNSLSSITADTSYSTIAPENGSSFIEHVNGVSHEKGILAGAGVAVAGAAAVVGSKLGAGSPPSSEAPAKAIPSIPKTVVSEPSSSSIPAVVSSKSSKSAEVELLESQLAQARREIESLKTQLATSTANELRQRKATGTTSTTSATAIQHPGSVEGVPVQVALSLVAATFVFTWSVLASLVCSLVRRLMASCDQVVLLMKARTRGRRNCWFSLLVSPFFLYYSSQLIIHVPLHLSLSVCSVRRFVASWSDSKLVSRAQNRTRARPVRCESVSWNGSANLSDLSRKRENRRSISCNNVKFLKSCHSDVSELLDGVRAMLMSVLQWRGGER